MPPLTVASFATTTHSRPSTTPMPVTIPADGRLPVVDVPGGQSGQLEEGGARVDEPVDALAGGQLPARAVPLDRAARRRPRATCAVRSRSSATRAAITLAAAGEELAARARPARSAPPSRGAYRLLRRLRLAPSRPADRKRAGAACWERQKAEPHRLATSAHRQAGASSRPQPVSVAPSATSVIVRP